jgi:hypothetical protein
MFDQAVFSILAHQLGLELSDKAIATGRHPFNRKTIIYIDRDVQIKTKSFGRVYLLQIYTFIPLVRYLRKAKKLFLRVLGLPLYGKEEEATGAAFSRHNKNIRISEKSKA